MDRRPNQETLKVSRETLVLVRQIAALTGEKQYRVLHRLLTREWARLERQRQQGVAYVYPP